MKKELNYTKGFLKSVEVKLSNEKFVQNAPQPLVDKERKKQAVTETSMGTTTTTSESENKSSNLSIGFGMAILLGDYITLEPTLSYNMMSQTVVDGGFDASGNTVDRVTKMSQIHFGINLSYHLEM